MTKNKKESPASVSVLLSDWHAVKKLVLAIIGHFNAFYFAPALAPGMSLSSLFSTHPPLQKRLDQLAKLDAEMRRNPA